MSAPSGGARPEVLEAVLDADRLEQLVADLTELVGDVEIRLRRAGESWSRPGGGDPAILLQFLRGSAGGGAQIRYSWSGQRWCDSITAVIGGYRLLRIVIPPGAGPGLAGTSTPA